MDLVYVTFRSSSTVFLVLFLSQVHGKCNDLSGHHDDGGLTLADVMQESLEELKALKFRIFHNATIFIGNPGAEAAAISKIFATDYNGGENPATNSQNLTPKLRISTDRKYVFLDVPSLSNKESLLDVATKLYLKRVVQSVSSARIVFLTARTEYAFLDNFANYAVQFLKDLNIMKNSFGVIFTSGFNVNPKFNVSNTSQDTLNDITKSLVQYRATLLDQLCSNVTVAINRQQIMTKILLINVLLQRKSISDGKVTFVVNLYPGGASGNLNAVKDTQNRVLRFLNVLEFMPFSNQSKKLDMDIRNTITSGIVNNCISKVSKVVADGIKRHLQHFQIWLNKESTRDLDQYPYIPDTFFRRLTKLDNLTYTRTFSSPKITASEIIKWTSTVGYNVGSTLENCMQGKQSLYEFCEDASVIRRDMEAYRWFEVIEIEHSAILSKKQQTVTQLVNKINNDVTTFCNTLNSQVETFFYGKIASLHWTAAKRETEQAFRQVSNFQAFRSLIDLLDKTKFYLRPVGYTLSHGVEQNLQTRNAMFQKLENLTNANIHRLYYPYSWTYWFRQLQTYFSRLNKWYTFIESVSVKIVTYSFQTIRARFSRISQPNWVQLLNNEFNYVVSSDISEIGSSYASNSTAYFRHFLSIFETDQTQERTECQTFQSREPSESDLIMLKSGRIVILSEVLRDKNSIGCSSSNNLEIYATERLFVDCDIYAVGKEYSVILVAPVWEIVKSVDINLSGSNGADQYPSKAPQGTNGYAGYPGNPGGVFLGVYSEIVNPSYLRVKANGGNGGRAQDGGDGAKGRDYIHHSDTSLDLRVFGRSDETHNPGGRGGNGGHGGRGGAGGAAGSVRFYPKQSYSISVQTTGGSRGTDGAGGSGGIGGEGQTGEYCITYTFIFQYGKKCYDAHGPRGPNGNRGKSGQSIIYEQSPRQRRTEESVSYVRNRFRLFAQSNPQVFF